MGEQQVPHNWRTSKLRKAGYGLFMLGFAAWLGFFASGLMFGFSRMPTSLGGAALLWAEWTGYTLVATVISLIVLAVTKPKTAFITFFLLVVGSAYLMKPRTETTQSSPRNPKTVTTSSSDNRLTATEFLQSSQGATESDIDSDFIAKIEGFLLKDKQAQYERVMRSAGKAPMPDALIASSQLVREGENQLVVTEITHRALEQGGTTLKLVWWIQGDQLKLVQCADRSGAPIALHAGKCGRQIAQTFGFTEWLIEN